MKDLIGRAMLDYYKKENKGKKLWVHYADGSKDEMPVATYFRSWEKMPLLEQIAIQECRGKVLDIGAGAGSHALLLQENNLEVVAMDFSPGACAVAKERGVLQVLQGDIFEFKAGKFDTLLLLMNGIGLTADLAGLKIFLYHAEQLLATNGQILFDSSNVSYLYEDGTPPPPPPQYYGEVSCQYAYGGDKTDWFTWLYIDQAQLKKIAAEEGWRTQLLFEDEEEQYLMRLTKA